MVRTSSRIIGDTEYVAATEKWQFDDYSKKSLIKFPNMR
jgi:hypothetical protein